MSSTERRPEPVGPDATAAIARPLLTQWWLDLAFVHWAVDPERVAGLPPQRAEPVSVLYSPGVPVRLGAPAHRIGAGAQVR